MYVASSILRFNSERFLNSLNSSNKCSFSFFVCASIDFSETKFLFLQSDTLDRSSNLVCSLLQIAWPEDSTEERREPSVAMGWKGLSDHLKLLYSSIYRVTRGWNVSRVLSPCSPRRRFFLRGFLPAWIKCLFRVTRQERQAMSVLAT